MSQDNGKCILSNLVYSTRTGHSIKDRNSCCHLLQEIFCDFFIHSYFILFLMFIGCTHHFVDDITIICHQQQSMRILIESSDISHTHRIIQETDNAVPLSAFFCTDNPARLIHCQHDHLVLFGNDFISNFHNLSRHDTHTGLRTLSINRHASSLNEAVCLPSGTHARLAQIFIQPYRLTLL